MKNNILWVILLVTPLVMACEDSFLNEKYNKSHVVPTTLGDLEAILDDDLNMNGSGSTARGPVPGLGEAAADDYYITDATFLSNLISQTRNYYTWAHEVYDNYDPYEWQYPYACIFNANIALDGLGKIEQSSTNGVIYNRVRGTALFHRSHAFFQLSQIYCQPFIKEDAENSPGLPLRLESDLGEKLSRSSLKETYERIITDLQKSISLLPEVAAIKTRPSKQTAYGLLSRVFLTMQDFDNAKLYADSCLAIGHTLLDYNNLNTNSAYPFAGGAHNHPEVIFACNMILRPTNMPFRPGLALIDTLLYNSYSDDDLRKKALFQKTTNGFSFKGSYEGNSYLFAGIAIDEIYLIRAECLARKNRVQEAARDLSILMANRWDKAKDYPDYSSYNQEYVLNVILNERRKELLFRGLRWMDLRRLNLEGRDISIRRVVAGKEYILSPRDKRYTYPIPPEVMGFNAEWVQNDR